MALDNDLSGYLNMHNLAAVSLPDKLTLKSEIGLKCTMCNTEFKISIRQLLYPHPKRTHSVCPNCAVKEKYITKLGDLYGRNPYEFKTPFKGYMNPLTVKCKDCGYEFTVNKAKTLLLNAHMKPGHHPCKQCAKLEYASRKKTQSIDSFKQQLINKFGGCFYEFPYPEEFRLWNQKEKIHIICKQCGHEMFTYPNNILNPKHGKHYCRVCNKKDRLLDTMSYKDRCELVTNGQITPIEEYIDSKTPIMHHCNKCNYEWKKIPVKNTLRNAGCPKCKRKISVSNAETEVLEYIKTLYKKKIITKDRTILNGKEIDIYLPDIHLGFEIDGLYYHSSKYKDKYYHLNKQLDAYAKGVKLIHIYDSIWYHENDRLKRIIQAYIDDDYTLETFGDTLIIDRRYAIKDDPRFKDYTLEKEIEPQLEYFNGNLSATEAILSKNKINAKYKSIYNCGYLVYRKENV